MVLGEKPHKRVGPSPSWASPAGHLLPVSQQKRIRNRFQGHNSNNVLPHSNEAGTYHIGDVYTPLEQKRPWEINT